MLVERTGFGAKCRQKCRTTWRRRRSGTWRVATAAILLALATGCEGHDGGTSEAPAKHPAASAAKAGAVASALTADVGCSGSQARTGVARLTWKPSGSATQRIEMAVLADGFKLGQFETSPDLPPGQATYTWEGLHGQAFHFWRVASQSDDTWNTSEPAKFEGPTCPSDTE